MKLSPDGEEVAQQGVYKVSRDLLQGIRRATRGRHRSSSMASPAYVGAAMNWKPIVEFKTWNFGMQADHVINSAEAKT